MSNENDQDKKEEKKESTSPLKRNSKRDFAPVSVKRGVWSVWHLYLCIALSAFIALYTFLLASGDSFEYYSESSMRVVFIVFLAAVLMVFCLGFLTYCKLRNSKFELRKRCVRYITGRYSIKQDVTEINYEDIGWVRVSQSIIERLLNLGTIEIGAAHSHIPEISVTGRLDPHKYANKIHRRLARTRKPIPGVMKTYPGHHQGYISNNSPGSAINGEAEELLH